MSRAGTDPLGERPLPERLDMERLVLGAALTDIEAFPQICTVLSAEDFSLEKHRRIFRCATELQSRGEPLNHVSTGNELIRRGQLESVDGLSYLVSLSDGMPMVVNLASYCQPIRAAAVRRQAIESMTALIDRCFDPGEDTGDLLARAERVTEMLNVKGGRQLAARTMERIIADEGGLNAFLSPQEKPGIHVPFPTIHSTLSGLRRAKFIIIGARPSVGKTALAAQIGEHAAGQGHRVLLFSLEMSARDVLHRSLTGRARLSAYKFRNGYLSPNERNLLQNETVEMLEYGDKLQIVDDGDTTVQGISNLLRALKARGEEVDLCVIDYLQLLNSVGHFENRVQEVSKISRELKKISKTFNIPVVALCQLKRVEDHRKNDRPELDWLKESGQIEQDADQVLFLWVKRDPEEGEKTREVLWRVAKNRDGILNNGALTFHNGYCRFDEAADGREAMA